MKVVTGSLQGILRVHHPAEAGFRIEDLLLEQDLGAPILQVSIGRFIPCVLGARDYCADCTVCWCNSRFVFCSSDYGHSVSYHRPYSINAQKLRELVGVRVCVCVLNCRIMTTLDCRTPHHGWSVAKIIPTCQLCRSSAPLQAKRQSPCCILGNLGSIRWTRWVDEGLKLVTTAWKRHTSMSSGSMEQGTSHRST